MSAVAIDFTLSDSQQELQKNAKAIAEVAGTSLLQISKTYGHCIPGAAERMRAKRDAFNADRGTFGHGAGTVN